MTIEEKFAQRLKHLRNQAEITQEELAQRTGIEYKYIQKLEGKNPNSATIGTIEKLANALGVEPHELLNFGK